MYNPQTSFDKGRQKMEKIGKAAARVFDRIGYLEANLDDVAAAAKMSKGGVYHYFASKEEILFFVLDNYMDRVLENLESRLSELPTGSAKLEFIISRHIELYARYKEESKTLLHDSSCLSKKYRQRIHEKERKYLALAVKAINDYMEHRNGVKPQEATTLSFLLFGMCNWCYQWYDPRGEINSESLSRIIWRVFEQGISSYPAGGMVS